MSRRDPNVQCKACPWRVSTVPERDIPDGYDVEKHRALKKTIAPPGVPSFGGPVRMMACHESGGRTPRPCVGWLAHQLGPGNNLGLRVLARDGRWNKLRTVGAQHERFEDTLPKGDRG